jgi:hypothetical protein
MIPNLQNTVLNQFVPSDFVWAAAAGLFAAIVMILVETPLWKKWGFQGVAEWQINWVIVTEMNKKWKGLAEPKLSWTLVSHLFHGVVAGIIFGILLPVFLIVGRLPQMSALWIGLLYGTSLWFLFAYSSRRTFESTGRIKLTKRGMLGALLSDSIYGLVLGLIIWVGIH